MCRIFAEPIKLLVRCDLHVTPEAIVQIPEFTRSVRTKRQGALRDGGVIGLNFPVRISPFTLSITCEPQPPGAKSRAICRSHSSMV